VERTNRTSPPLHYFSRVNSQERHIHQDLIDRCKLNDQQAQLKVYQLYHRAVYTTAVRLMRNTMDAEEMMQEAFLTAFNKLHLYQSGSSFGAWIKQITVRKCIDQLRLKELEWTSLKEEDSFEEQPSSDNEWNKFEVERITKTIQEMPNGYRTILSLYLLEGYDHEEIGTILEISSSTSRSQYTRAKKKLKKELEAVSS